MVYHSFLLLASFQYCEDIMLTDAESTIVKRSAKIGKLYFGAYDEKKGAIESIMNIYNYNNFFIPEVYGGIKEIECSLLLKKFFSLIRKKNGKKT